MVWQVVSPLNADRSRVARWLTALILGLVIVSCGDDPPSTSSSGGGATTTEVEGVVTLSASGEVGCAIAKVGVGAPNSNQLDTISSCNEPIPVWERLQKNGRVTTDAAGEAQVRVDSSGQCGILYVFRDSDLIVSDCQKGSTASACVQSGSVGFNNNCSGVVAVQTPSATVTLKGTWVTISYVPESDVTLVASFEGNAEVAPNDDPENFEVVGANTFYYTSRGDEVTGLGGVESRSVNDVAVLPPVITGAGLQTVFAGVFDRAIDDGVFPDQLEGFDLINLRAGGDLLSDRAIGDAILSAIDWPAKADELRAGGFENINTLFGTLAGSHAWDYTFDLGASREVLTSREVFDELLILIFETRDAQLAEAMMTASPGQEFGEGGLGGLFQHFSVELIEVADTAEARALFADVTEEGGLTIWISRS